MAKATTKKSSKSKNTKSKAKAKPKAKAKKVVTSKKSTVKKSSTKAKAKSKPKAKKTKRTPNAAFMRPMNIGEPLQAIVGSKPIPRTEVTKRVWNYIKKNGLQDKVNRRNINADDNLRKVFGGKKTVSMFEMTKLVNKYLS